MANKKKEVLAIDPYRTTIMEKLASMPLRTKLAIFAAAAAGLTIYAIIKRLAGTTTDDETKDTSISDARQAVEAHSSVSAATPSSPRASAATDDSATTQASSPRASAATDDSATTPSSPRASAATDDSATTPSSPRASGDTTTPVDANTATPSSPRPPAAATTGDSAATPSSPATSVASSVLSGTGATLDDDENPDLTISAAAGILWNTATRYFSRGQEKANNDDDPRRKTTFRKG